MAKTRSETAAPDAPSPETLAPYQRVLAEGPLSFPEAFREARVPLPNYDALWRLRGNGKLDTCRIAGKTFTSIAAVKRMVAAQNAPGEPALPERAPRAQRGRGRRVAPKTSAAAKAYLRARGLPTGEVGE